MKVGRERKKKIERVSKDVLKDSGRDFCVAAFVSERYASEWRRATVGALCSRQNKKSHSFFKRPEMETENIRGA